MALWGINYYLVKLSQKYAHTAQEACCGGALQHCHILMQSYQGPRVLGHASMPVQGTQTVQYASSSKQVENTVYSSCH